MKQTFGKFKGVDREAGSVCKHWRRCDRWIALLKRLLTLALAGPSAAMGRGQAEACTVAEKGAGLGAVGISSWLPQPRLLIVRVWIPWECSVLTVMGNTGVLLGCLVLGLMHLSALGQQTGLQKVGTVTTCSFSF